MIYLKKLYLLNENEESQIKLIDDNRLFPISKDELYPRNIFPKKIFEQIDFDDITIFYGGNGSGKSTLLNIISEKLELKRFSTFGISDYFRQYIAKCYIEKMRIPDSSKFISSNDIFQKINQVNEKNNEMKEIKKAEMDYWEDKNYKPQDSYNINFDTKEGLSEFNKYYAAKRTSRVQFIKKYAGEIETQFSNGENALKFFEEEIEKDALYLLDEPENSMSPKFQIELKNLIEVSARYLNCQFVIATHSPFVLSIPNAKIYNLDIIPVGIQKWYELDNIKVLYSLFHENRGNFE